MLRNLAYTSLVAGLVSFSAVACSKSAPDVSTDTHTTGAQVDTPPRNNNDMSGVQNGNGVNNPALNGDVAPSRMGSTERDLRAAPTDLELPATPPPGADLAGRPPNGVAPATRDTSYGGSANGGSSGPSTNGKYTSTGPGRVAHPSAAPGHVLSPARTIDLTKDGG